MDLVKLKDRSMRGEVRDGPGKGETWDYNVDRSPRYYPVDKAGNREVDIQVAELLDYSVNVLNLPLFLLEKRL